MAKKGKEAPMLLVKQKIRETLKGIGDYQVASDLPAALSAVVEAEIKEAVLRAQANKRKTVSARDVTGAKFKEPANLVVQSKVRETIKGLGDFNVAKDFFPALNYKVETMIKQVAKRASANGRKTCQARDC